MGDFTGRTAFFSSITTNIGICETYHVWPIIDGRNVTYPVSETGQDILKTSKG